MDWSNIYHWKSQQLFNELNIAESRNFFLSYNMIEMWLKGHQTGNHPAIHPIYFCIHSSICQLKFVCKFSSVYGFCFIRQWQLASPRSLSVVLAMVHIQMHSCKIFIHSSLDNLCETSCIQNNTINRLTV